MKTVAAVLSVLALGALCCSAAADTTGVFGWRVDAYTSVQYRAAGTDTAAPTALGYDDHAPLFGFDGDVTVGENVRVRQDIRFMLREDRYFTRRPFSNVITDLTDFNSHIFRESYLEVTHGRAAFTAGRRHYRFGPGRGGAILLSDNVPFYDVFAVAYPFGSAQYDFLTSRLNMEHTPTVYTYHRLSFPLPWGIRMGLAEANLVFADSYDLLNLNPVVFYHNIDRKTTNYIGGGDFELVRPGWRAWWELGIDNVLARAIETSSQSPTGLGWLAGAAYGAADGPFTLFAEYTRIDRYMYARDAQGIRGDSLHFAVVRDYPHVTACINAPGTIGYWSGPNSETVNAGVEFRRPSLRLAGTADYLLLRRGSLAATETLAGTVEQRHVARVSLTWQPLAMLLVEAEYAHSEITDYLNSAGDDRSLDEFGLTMSLNYLSRRGRL